MGTAPLTALPPCLAVLEFAAPALAWGAAAATVPVLIHLLLRPRTRRQVLPTMRFLLRAHQSANRTHRLKRFLLLACRIAVVLLLVTLLMRPGYRPDAAAASSGPSHPPGMPVSAVFAFDNSASMAYRFQGQTRLAWALQHARVLMEDTSRFPSGSQIGIVTGPPQNIPPTWMEPSAAPRYLSRLAPQDHDIGAVRLLEQSYAMLRHGRHAVREVYLFTDLTRHAWTGSVPAAPPELSGVYVADVGQSESPNVSLAWPRAATPLVPASRPSELTVSVTAVDVRADNHQLSIDVDGQRRGAAALPPLDANGRRDVTVQVPPLDPGAHRITLRLEPEDALSADNQRFTIVSAGAPPRVVLVGEQDDSEVPRLLHAMIAPPAQPPHHHRFALDAVRPAALDSASTEGAFMVILADVPAVGEPQWKLIEVFVRSGGSVLIVPGSQVAPAGYAGATLLPASILGAQNLDPPLGLAAADLTHAYLRPFDSEDVDSINTPRAYRRLRVGPLLPGSRVIAPFEDGQPALLERVVGAGRIQLLTFSPQREWGQFGTQAAPFLVLLQTMLNELAPKPQGTGSYAAGQGVSFPLTQPADSDFFLVGGPAKLPIPPDTGRVVVPTVTAGAYQLCRDAANRDILLTYSVNVREAESDLARITDDELLIRLPPGRTQILHEPAALLAGVASAASGFGLLVPILLVLLGLMCVESLFSNRFYGNSGAPVSASEPGGNPPAGAAGADK